MHLYLVIARDEVPKQFHILKSVGYLWIPAIFTLIIIPLLYSFFINKSLRELLIITLLFIIISSTISLSVMNISRNFSGGDDVYMFIFGVFGINPISSIDTPICAPYGLKTVLAGPEEKIELCPLQKYGLFIEIITLSLISFIVIGISMVADLGFRYPPAAHASIR